MNCHYALGLQQLEPFIVCSFNQSISLCSFSFFAVIPVHTIIYHTYLGSIVYPFICNLLLLVTFTIVLHLQIQCPSIRSMCDLICLFPPPRRLCFLSQPFPCSHLFITEMFSTTQSKKSFISQHINVFWFTL